MVSDPNAMILRLVGTRQASNELITDWARDQILKALRTGVVKKLTAEKWPVLGLAARAAESKPRCSPTCRRLSPRTA